MKKTCIACGMTMQTPDDFALGDVTKPYCRHCVREDGSMQSYEEKVEALTAFVIETQGFAKAAARDSVKGMLTKLPAWKNI